jgi:hypothetical protein
LVVSADNKTLYAKTLNQVRAEADTLRCDNGARSGVDYSLALLPTRLPEPFDTCACTAFPAASGSLDIALMCTFSDQRHYVYVIDE